MYAPSLQQPPGGYPHYPLMTIPVPPSILKKSTSYNTDSTSSPSKKPPGVPPFVPPDFTNETFLLLLLSSSSSEKPIDNKNKSKSIRFSDDKDEETDGENREKNNIINNKELEKVKPTSVQQKMLAMAGQDIDEFMRDMESAHKKKEIERAHDLNTRLSHLVDNNERNKLDIDTEQQRLHLIQQQHHHHHGLPSMTMPPPPPPPLMFRPPPPPMHMRMPPPPPPRIGLRLPPGPPPGMPRMLRPPSMPRIASSSSSSSQNLIGKTPNVLSAAPQLINRKDDDKLITISTTSSSSSALTTIKAKPQIRNLAADVTRFLPTSVRVKRDDKKKLPTILRLPERIVEVIKTPQPKTKDDAYMQFMQEMENLL